ncbi:ABC transporter permease [Romboutsia maritimum]|uniref:ABC transporter permease n=1 Tax=Romboutsia maritimum TaxID=2020948 RepID=A0A371ITL9_9FIRM|nr:ABC transporter permease [Romboutsia maritimum]RDY23834.1 ABC transporter permease [Romboutsia maritimum]
MRLIKSAISNLRGHKLRVFMALLWIIIGITSVIIVSSIGNGLEAQVQKSVSKVSNNKIKIKFEPNNYSMQSMSAFLKPFTNQDIETLSFIEGVDRIAPSKEDFDMGSTQFASAMFDKKTSDIEISPLKKDSTVKAMYGRNFTLDDENRRVVMITIQNATDLFDSPENSLGKGITINNNIYEVIGVVDESSISTDSQNEDPMSTEGGYATAYIPKKAFDDLMTHFAYTPEVLSLDLVCSKGYDVFDVANTVISKLYELHPGIDGTYMTEDPSEQAAQQEAELQSLTYNVNRFIPIITFVSLFVGGIGVMNIMYVSVMERQREIGIRRAIGAKPRTILFQFLVESTFITILGGILGILIGFISTKYVSNYLPFKAIPNLKSFVFASITTILVGIIFGIVPAFKASRLDPIKAIYKQ